MIFFLSFIGAWEEKSFIHPLDFSNQAQKREEKRLEEFLQANHYFNDDAGLFTFLQFNHLILAHCQHVAYWTKKTSRAMKQVARCFCATNCSAFLLSSVVNLYFVNIKPHKLQVNAVQSFLHQTLCMSCGFSSICLWINWF